MLSTRQGWKYSKQNGTDHTTGVVLRYLRSAANAVAAADTQKKVAVTILQMFEKNWLCVVGTHCMT